MQEYGCTVLCNYIIFSFSLADCCIRQHFLVYHTQLTLVLNSGTFMVGIVFLVCQMVLCSSAAADSSSAALSPEGSWLTPKRQPTFQWKKKIIQKNV